MPRQSALINSDANTRVDNHELWLDLQLWAPRLNESGGQRTRDPRIVFTARQTRLTQAINLKAQIPIARAPRTVSETKADAYVRFLCPIPLVREVSTPELRFKVKPDVEDLAALCGKFSFKQIEAKPEPMYSIDE